MPFSYRYIPILIAVFVLMPFSTASAQDIRPADVYQLVSELNAEIEHLRWYMGRPVNRQPAPQVRNVSPREVFFQVRTLYEKANRLAFETTQSSEEEPSMPEGDLHPRDVYRLMKAAHYRVQHVNYTLGTRYVAKPVSLDTGKTPTDVFEAVVQANRQLNLMLDRRYSPSDVFYQVTVAMTYAERILASLPNQNPPPFPPVFQPGKQPLDVFIHLLTVYDLVQKIGDAYGVKMLELDRWTKNDEDIRPSDVFDVASLVVSELTAVYAKLGNAEPPRKVLRVHGKYPSDVCQRVMVLEGMLKDILERKQ